MTAKPDLAALARAFVAAYEASKHGFVNRSVWSAYDALRDAVLSEPAADEVTWSELWAACVSMRAQIAAAAPLFEAAHGYLDEVCSSSDSPNLLPERRSAVLRTVTDWARSEAGQRWKKEQGK